MILIPGVLAYVFTPRTGSRATEAAFLKHVPDAMDIGRHHGYTPGPEKVYATIRDPVDQVLSHYWKFCKGGKGKPITLKQYIIQREPRLNPHREIVDEYFLYEDGLENIFERLGYPGIQLEHIGATNPPKDLLTQDITDLINKTFAEDVALYSRIVNGGSSPQGVE